MEAWKNYHEFVEIELKKVGLKLVPITEQTINDRLIDIMGFVNNVRAEFNYKYGWLDESKEYFLNPMDRKFSYSYFIENENSEIVIMNFASVYGNRLHLHCMLAGKSHRKCGLAKLLIMKICDQGFDDGLEIIGGFWPKINNGSLILFLKFGLRIEYMRDNIELFLSGQLKKIASNAMKMYCKERNCDEYHSTSEQRHQKN